MSLATRVSVAFLVALALALGGFSASLYYLAGLQLRHALEEELEAALDRFPRGGEGQVGRVTWAFLDESGHRVEGGMSVVTPCPLEGRDIGPLAVAVPMTITAADNSRWEVLVRRVPGGRRRGGPPGGDPDGEGRRSGRHDRERDRDRDEPRRNHPDRDRSPTVLAAWTELGPVEAEIGWLGAALPLLSVGLWTLTALIGRHFARRALAPLAQMAETARTMAAEDARLPSPGTRDELENFAGSFNGLLDRLHIALDRQRQFTGQASHQLRTPLAALIATIEVARRRPRTVPEHERTLDRLRDDSTRLNRIVEALLFLARADAEAALPDLEPIDLPDWAADHLQNWADHDRAPDLRFEADGIDQPRVRAHRPLLGQLLDNLVENAIKSSAPGSPIVIRVDREGSTLTLSVADRGTGIDPSDLPRVFEPFYQAEAARRAGRAGVGLGLAIARRIAQAHGGQLTAESTPGEGSRFVLDLPIDVPPDLP